MRLHTDTITSITVKEVMTNLTGLGLLDGVYADTVFTGSRKRQRGMDLRLTAEPRKGRRRFTNRGYAGHQDGTIAATWDEWGLVLAALYEVDQNMTGVYYADAEHYHWATGERFSPAGWDTFVAHDNHQWARTGANLTNVYSVGECEKCGALKRWAMSKAAFESVFGRFWGDRIEGSA